MQACLVDIKKDNEKDNVYLNVSTGKQKICIGMLSADKFPQIVFDLVFDKDFEISHTSKTGSVHLCGYKTNMSEYPLQVHIVLSSILLSESCSTSDTFHYSSFLLNLVDSVVHIRF